MASEYLKWKYRDVRPDRPVELTPRQRRQNWWHYHRWHVLLCGLAVCIAGNLIWHAVTRVHPDYQVAYVAAAPLSEEVAAAWEARLAALGADVNGDGRVVVQLNQYPSLPEAEDPMYRYASDIKLMADLDACESYFFLLDDPEGFQREYEVLQEDWFSVENALYLARRTFWQDRVPESLEDCELLWKHLAEEVK